MFKSILLPIIVWAVLLLGIPLGATALSVHDFRQDCDRTGGTFSNEGFTAWCRY